LEAGQGTYLTEGMAFASDLEKKALEAIKAGKKKQGGQ